jgi:hypothetical protein
VQVGKVGYPNTSRLKAVRSGAAAHMSLHLFITMSKSRPSCDNPPHKKPDTHGSPIFLPEERASCYVGDQTAEAPLPVR